MQLQQNKIIELRDVTVGYDHHVVLKDVNLEIHEGDFVAITGPNGGGKTSLLRIILGLLLPESGEVNYYDGGKRVKHLKVGYLPQKNMIDNRFPVTVEEVISAGLLRKIDVAHQRLTAEDKKRVDETVELIRLEAERKSPIGELSGGQLQRTLFGRAVISEPTVLVLDEPLSYLDKDFESHLYEIIAELAKRMTIILVSHEMTQIAQMANRHIIVDKTLHDCHAAHHFVKTDCE